MTRVLTVDSQNPDAAVIAEAAAIIRAGGLVAFPTETVYGLGANALDREAVARIFVAKGRPTSDPLIVHLADSDDLSRIATDLPLLTQPLVAHFWPGPLTLVLRRQPLVPDLVSAGRPTVAVRMPSHPVAQALIRAAATPIAAPSANLFTRTSPTTAQHVLEDLEGRIDLVLDGGSTAIGLESTVLDLTGEVPQLLRPGGVPLEALRTLIGEVEYQPRYLQEDSAEGVAAPGMLLRHYSPRAELLLFTGDSVAVLARIHAEAERLLVEGRRVGVLLPDEALAAVADLPVETASLGPLNDSGEMAARLFAGLRALDARGVTVILTHAPSREGLGLAIWDRLFRATEGHLIEVV